MSAIKPIAARLPVDPTWGALLIDSDAEGSPPSAKEAMTFLRFGHVREAVSLQRAFAALSKSTCAVLPPGVELRVEGPTEPPVLRSFRARTWLGLAPPPPTAPARREPRAILRWPGT